MTEFVNMDHCPITGFAINSIKRNDGRAAKQEYERRPGYMKEWHAANKDRIKAKNRAKYLAKKGESI